MKVHYFNILLIALPLNILVSSPQKNPSITQKRPTTRLLCECELYSTTNYDNDPQMKSVIDNFNKQTQQRLHEYDERMKTTRQECKEQCDKEIQKIILKDKLEKELMDKFATLHTDIQSDAIPTCVCEKSIADKTEKLCLKCGYGIGSNVPLVGLINGLTFYASVLKYAVDSGISEGARVVASETLRMVTELLTKSFSGIDMMEIDLASIMTKSTTTPMHLALAVDGAVQKACNLSATASHFVLPDICLTPNIEQTNLYLKVAGIAGEASKFGKAAGTVAAEDAKLKAWNAAFTWEKFLCSPLGISIIVTVCIVVMLIIIYLILRYRRKKKMKKKIKYLKLFKE
ncbi:surface antigen [Plasmodium falciparum UGT5.1]|uniref:Surface antigen n=1 Tax=Plasmodium falciparum UGT5.1 TaxID=1237627 RepID=W7JYB6_PLAFA|nr:surface antigen [Plasmodium falciparum UGT5.1]